MHFKAILAATAATALLGACAHHQPSRNNETTAHTAFVVKAGPGAATTITVKKGEPFMARDVVLPSVAVLAEDYVFDPEGRKITIRKGTSLFGARMVRFDRAPARPVSPDLSGQDLGLDPNMPKSTASDPLYQMMTRKISQGYVYCGTMASKIDGGDLLLGAFSLGTTFFMKEKDVFCLEDIDMNGVFDQVWDSQLTYHYPPTIDSVYNKRSSAPVSYALHENDDFNKIGHLWFEVQSTGWMKPDYTVNGRLGTEKHHVDFDNLRKKIDPAVLPATMQAFGAIYKLIKIENDQYTFEISPATLDSEVSLSKTVTYSQKTTYIPIFIPR